MGGEQSTETRQYIGKVTSPLDEKLKSVKWGEFKVGDLFEVQTSKKRFDANKVTVLENGNYPYIVRMGSNNGQKGFIEENISFLNDRNTISFGQDTATIFYQDKKYFTGDKIKVLKPKETNKKFSEKNAQFFIATMTKAFSSFSWGSSSFNVNIIENQKLTLPVKNNQPNYAFMESFIAELEAERIAELEAERIAELEAYLKASELKDYTLTPEEEKVLSEYERKSFATFNIIDIFNVKNSGNILARDIVENSGKTPYLCASAENNAVSSYISYDRKYLDKGNCVFIGGKTFVVSYQENDFFSNDSHNLILDLKHKSAKTKLNQLYLSACVTKSLKYKYSWGDSISNKKIQKDKISLPTNNNQPDYSSMSTLISAIQKLVIKDVVLYADKKIAATKQITHSN